MFHRRSTDQSVRGPRVLPIFTALLLTVAFSGRAAILRADTIYWDGSGTASTTTGWNAVGSWSTSSSATTPDPAAIPGANDTAVFDISGLTTTQTVDLNASQSVLGLTFQNTGTTTIATGSGTNTLTLGTGGITLAASNTGAVTISSGLALGSTAQSWSSTSTAALSITGVLTGSGTLMLSGPAVTNEGVFIFNGNGAGFSDAVSVSNARMAFTNSAALGTAVITVASGGELYVNGASQTYTNAVHISGIGWSESAGNLGALRLNDASSTFAGNVTLDADASISSYKFATGLITGTISGNHQLEFRSGIAPASDTLTLTPTSQNTYGSTSINNSNATSGTSITLKAGDGFAFSSGGLSLKGATATTLAIMQINGSSFTFANLSSANAFAQIQNGSTTTAATISFGADGTATTYSGTLIDGSTAALAVTKVGSGATTLSGADTYSGLTTVSAGTLRLGIATAIPSGTGKGNVVLDGGVTAAGTLDLNGFSPTIDGLSGATGTVLGEVVNNGTSGGLATLTIGNNNATSSFAGIIADNTTGFGTVALTKVGSGVQTLSGNCTYSGSTTIAAGTLRIGANNSLPTATNITFGAAATNGTLDLAGFNQQVGNLAVAAAVPSGNVASQVIGSSGANGTTAVLTFSGTTSTFGGTIRDAIATANGQNVGLTVTAGSLTLSGANSYTGPTNVSGGMFRLGTGGSLGNTAIAVSNGAVFSPAAGTSAGTTGPGTAGASLAVTTGGVFNMLDNAISIFNLNQNSSFAGTALTLNGATLNFDLNGIGTDTLAVTQTASVAGTNIININPLGTVLGSGTYNLITAAGGLNSGGGSFQFGNGSTTQQLTLNVITYTLTLQNSGTAEQLVVTGGNSFPVAAYWNGSLSTSWSTGGMGAASNWTSDAAGTTDTLQLPGASTNVVFTANNAADSSSTTLDADYTINSLTFTGAGTSAASSVLISGNTLTISAGAAGGNTIGNGITVQSGSGAHTIASNVTLGAGQTWTNNSTSPLTVSGSVGDAGNALSLTTAGAGTIILTGANGYSGGTTIGGGSTLAFAGGALGTSGPIAIDGGTLRWYGVNNEDDSSRLVMLNGTTSTLDTNGNTVSLATAIGGATTGGLTLADSAATPGTLILTAAETYTGATTINAGTLQIGTGGATGSIASTSVVINGGGQLTLYHNGTGVILNFSVSGNGAWLIEGPGANNQGAFENTANDSGFSGTLTISNARYSSMTANGFGTGPVIVTSGGQIYCNGASVVYSAGVLHLSGIGWAEPQGNLGALRFALGAVWASNIVLDADASIGAYRSSGSITGTIGGNYQLEYRAGTTPLGDTLTLAPSGPNTYGSTRLNNSFATSPGNITLVAGNGNALSSGPLSFTGAGVNNLAVLQLNGNSFSFANLSSDNAFAQIQNGNPASGSTIAVGADGTSTTYSGTLVDGSNSASLSLTKVGAGILTLSGVNGYSGGTNITSGTLQLGANNALPGNTIVAFGSASGNGTLDLLGFNQQLAGLTVAASVPAANVASQAIGNSGFGTATLQVSGGTSNFAGTIQDQLGQNNGNQQVALAVAGGANFTLSGANTYSGGTTITGGTLRIANATGSATGSGPVTVGNGTTAAMLAGPAAPGQGAVAGAVIVNSGATLAAASGASLTIGGGLTLNGGSISSFALTTAGANNATPLVQISSGGLAGPIMGTHTIALTGNVAFGIYDLIGFSGPAPLLNGFTLGNTLSGGLIQKLAMAGNQLDLIVSNPNSSAAWNFNGSDNYSNALQWTPQAFPTGVGQSATFGNGDGVIATINAPAVAVTIDGVYTVSSLVFNNTNNTAYTLANDNVGIHGLTLDGGGLGAAIQVSANAPQQIAANLTLADATTVTIAGGSSLTISGTIGGAGANQSLTLNGGGTLTLGNTNTYTGGNVVNSGTLRTAADGALGSGPLAIVSAGADTPLVDVGGNESVGALTGSVSGSGSATIQIEPGKTLTVAPASGTATFAGVVNLVAGTTTPGSGGTLGKAGAGTELVSGTLQLNNGTGLNVSGGTLRVNASGGIVGAGVTANITGSGTLELAGAYSALGTSTAADRTEIRNASTAAVGLLVSSGNQQVGGIDGAGNVQVAPPSGQTVSLTADHITAGALIIGGDATSSALVTIAASDSSGNPLDSTGFALASSLEASSPFTGANISSSSLMAADESSSSGLSFGGSSLVSLNFGDGGAAVPEPSTIVLLIFGSLGILLFVAQRRASRSQALPGNALPTRLCLDIPAQSPQR